MVTIRASEQGLIQVDRARRRKGWLKQSEIWCRLAQTSRATLKRFWRREAIDQGTFIAICQAAGIQDWEAIAQSDVRPTEQHLCLGMMPDVPMFLGRAAEMAQLTDWSQTCRLIALWGMGGMGKTSLVAEWVESLLRSGSAQPFAAIFWRSLQYPPALDALARSLTEAAQSSVQSSVESSIQSPAQILTLLQQRRCLLILDSWEALLGGASAGQVKPEFVAFSQLFQQFATTRHQSCVVVISREKPAELALLEGLNPLVKSHKLEGMGQDAIALFESRGLQAELPAWQTLIQLYRGNPLALNMMASLIQDLCQGSATAFLKMNTIVVHQLDNVLVERLQCLSETELQVLQTLARVGQPISRESLQEKLGSVSGSQLLEILLSLEQRCLLEILSEETVLFALAPIVQKYISQKLSKRL
ncbi:NB-ARC domain-containing protein [Alkalinema pantanalense CENA528]|uniref:NB-ARC domain-containing protein n=1 Tax=Alkalinema pantanalense TaxID=1620705 RepID=UPI003D6E933E